MSAGTTCSEGQRNGDAYQSRLLSPTIEQTARPAGATRTAPTTSQSAPVMRRGRYRARFAPDDASITAPASPMAPPRPSTAASVRRSPMSATNAPPSASNDATPHQPAARSRGPAPVRAKPARVHRLGQRDRAFHAQLEDRHDLAQQPAAPHDAATGAGAVGVAHVADRGERRRHEGERDHHDEPDFVERARRRLHELRVGDDAVERAEHRHHPHDGEALGERLQDHRELDRPADGEAAEELRQHEVRAW